MSLSLSSAIVAPLIFFPLDDGELEGEETVSWSYGGWSEICSSKKHILRKEKLPLYTEKQLLSSYIDCDCDRGDQGVSMAEILYDVFNVIASLEINVEGEKMCLSTHDPTGNANIVWMRTLSIYVLSWHSDNVRKPNPIVKSQHVIPCSAVLV